jgi:hypothetical protein
MYSMNAGTGVTCRVRPKSIRNRRLSFCASSEAFPRIIRPLKNAPECDYSSFYVTTGNGNTGCLVAQDLALLTKVRTLIHEEISLLTVLCFPFRARTP